MVVSLRTTLLALISTGFLAGCSSTPYSPEPFSAASINTTAYVAKVDAFAVVMDASSSMNYDTDDRRNFYTAKDVATHMNATIPELGYKAALVGFGSGGCVNDEDAMVVYGPVTYQSSDFSSGLTKFECAGGVTPMAQGIDVAGGALKNSSGKVALIVISDFWEINSGAVTTAVDKLKTDFGSRLCIHTIKVGDAYHTSDMIAGLAGVNGSPVVMYEKNTMSASALFDHDKSVLKEEGKTALHALDESIKARSASIVDIDVIGHTDSDGTEEYNMALSIRRAEAVRDYMVSEGVNAAIIDVSGEGESNPVVSNATQEGRAENRRVDIHVGVKQPAN
jgi:outer membrane protein OmpA-like peptidoglycan-associated protein